MNRFLRLSPVQRTLRRSTRLKGDAALRRARLFAAFVYGAAEARLVDLADPKPPATGGRRRRLVGV